VSAPLLEQLIDALRVLPGVGQKTAQRMAYHLLEREREGGQRLAETLALAVERIGHCAQCRDFSETELCPTCANGSRERSQLCVVESPADRLAIENATGFRGVYFVLQGGCRRSMASARASWAWSSWSDGWPKARCRS
jgi:recombination protein RecR